ncbi:unnamed protein product [Ixodes pacificus]
MCRLNTAPPSSLLCADQEEAPSILATVDSFSCWNCTGVFSSWDLLEKHRKTVHGELEPRHRCSRCPYTSDYKYKVVAHERTHTGQKPFVCATCDRSFALQDSLTRHTRIHTGERPHVCATCGQSFAVLGNLKTHERTHTGERPYVCPQCGKSFVKKSDMTRHCRVHNRI